MWQRLQPASSRAGTALLLNRPASGTGSLFGGCSAHVRGSGSVLFQPEHLCPAAPGDSATTSCFVEPKLRRGHSPCLEQSWSAVLSKQQPLGEEAAGAIGLHKTR